MIVYLAGGINGLTDEEAKGWREQAKEMLTTGTADPMDRDYRGIEGNDIAVATEIVNDDLYEIRNSDALLVKAERPSWGTAMEIRYAYDEDIPTYVVVGDGPVSPWLRYHSTELFRTLEDAVAAINEEDEHERLARA